MRLGEALQITGQNTGERHRHVHLLCGSMPLHLETFVKAHLRLRFSGDAVCVHTGLFGDLEGNLQRAGQNDAERDAEGAIAVIEWSDLDPRLGFRSSSGWGARTLDDIAVQAEERCLRMGEHLATLAQAMPVAVAAPTLALPPLTHLPPVQTSAFELRLNAILIDFLQRVCRRNGIKVLNAGALELISPQAARHDLKMDLLTGFPYTLTHADTLAQMSVSCLFATAPKKGLITDLDQTLWKGILGDLGAEGVSWSLEGKAQAHALYQQVLASLADSGVLVAIASKNDPELAGAVLQRPDLLLKPSQIFPVEAGWGTKSDMVGRILHAWNIGADSVVLVDDSPMELAEVAERFPGIECLQFPSDDPAGILALLAQLRARFGKADIQEEDRLRMESLRAAANMDWEKPAEASADFLARLEAKITFEAARVDHSRAFELVNKTNQFNLNGARYTEAEWKSRLQRPGAFLKTVSYEDRFGPLGRIAVLGGCKDGDEFVVDVWVMSCRAFSRHIEFQTMRYLFAQSGASEIRLHFQPTERNGPLRTFFGHFFSPDSMAAAELKLSAAVFQASCPPLFHEVVEK